jgi:hypothetical protein
VHAWLADSGAQEDGFVLVLAALAMLAVLLRSCLRLAAGRLRPGRS